MAERRDNGRQGCAEIAACVLSGAMTAEVAGSSPARRNGLSCGCNIYKDPLTQRELIGVAAGETALGDHDGIVKK